MADEKQTDSHDLLIRIDERVKSIQEDIKAINEDRRCHTHTEKFRNLERAVYAAYVFIIGIISRLAYEAFK